MESLITRKTQLLIIDDFNLHLKDSTQPSSICFLDLLTQFGLLQHVNETTHLLIVILDLVITSVNGKVQGLLVYPPTISDPSFIQLSCCFERRFRRTKDPAGGFRPILEPDLRLVLSSSSLKCCEVDSLPPCIVVDIWHDIVPFV